MMAAKFIFTIPLSVLLFAAGLTGAVPENRQGGNFSWTTLQAEDGRTNAQVIGPSRRAGDPAAECVGRRGVMLTKQGDYVEFKVPRAINSAVLRYSIPDAPAGGGIEASLSVYVDGRHRADLKLTSHHSWLYGKENRLVNDPAAGSPRCYFDEARALIGDVPAGAVLRLQKDRDDTAGFYTLDLIDLELVSPPLPCPPKALAVTAFGAVPDDDRDDTAAIEKAIAEAEKVGKTLYFPAGVYLTGKKFNLAGAVIQGAGMWYTTLLHRRTGGDKTKGVGFNLEKASQIRDLAIFGAGTIRRDESGGIGGLFGDGSVVERVWIEHTNTGIWPGKDNQPSPRRVTVRHCRFRNTYADGINLCNGTSESVVEDCHARNTGDDSFAAWSCKFGKAGADRANVFRRCTAEVPWRARCFAVFGGRDIRIEDCIGRDTLVDSGINLSTEFEALPFGGTITVSNLLLERCGGYFWGNRPYGAVFLHAQSRDFTGKIVFDRLRAIDSSCFGITVAEGKCRIADVLFRDCSFLGADKFGIYVFPQARGEITLENVVFKLDGKPLVENRSAENFKIINLTKEQ